MPQKSLKKNAFYNFVKCFMNIIFPIISFPYASRILLPEGIGKVNFANSIIEYFLMLAGLGIGTYASREAAKIRDNKQLLNKFSREILVINLLSTIFSYILLAFAIFFIPKIAEHRLLIIVCSTKVLFTTAGVTWLFTAFEDYRYITLRSILFQVISLFLLFVFVHDQNDYYAYAAIGVFSNVGSNVLNFIYSRKYLNLFEKSKLQLKKHIKPILTFFGIASASKINNSLDAVMLGFMINNVSVGFYTAALKLSKMVIELITSIISSIMPRSSYYIENNRIDEYKKIVSKVCCLTFFFSIPAAAGLFMLCEPLIIVFSGKEYLPAAPAMKILSVGIVGWCANSFLNNLIITPQRKEKFSLAAQICAVVFNVIFNIIFIKRLEVFGAALATVIVEFILPLVVLIPSLKYLKSPLNLWGIVKSIAGTAAMIAVLYFTTLKIESNFVKIITSVLLGSAVYAAAEIIMRHPTAKLILDVIKAKARK